MTSQHHSKPVSALAQHVLAVHSRQRQQETGVHPQKALPVNQAFTG